MRFFKWKKITRGKNDNYRFREGSLGKDKSGLISENIDQNYESWDPEDDVRYVVKWKGMQAPEVT